MTLFQDVLDYINQQVLLFDSILTDNSLSERNYCDPGLLTCSWSSLGQQQIDEIDTFLENLGDPTCINNAHSPYLKCAVSPSNECSSCPNYEKQEELQKEDL